MSFQRTFITQFATVAFTQQQPPDTISYSEHAPDCCLGAYLAHTVRHEHITQFFSGLASSPFPSVSIQALKSILISTPRPWHSLNPRPCSVFISPPSPASPSLSHRPRRGSSVGLLLLPRWCCYALIALPRQGGARCPAPIKSRGAPEC